MVSKRRLFMLKTSTYKHTFCKLTNSMPNVKFLIIYFLLLTMIYRESINWMTNFLSTATNEMHFFKKWQKIDYILRDKYFMRVSTSLIPKVTIKFVN